MVENRHTILQRKLGELNADVRVDKLWRQDACDQDVVHFPETARRLVQRERELQVRRQGDIGRELFDAARKVSDKSHARPKRQELNRANQAEGGALRWREHEKCGGGCRQAQPRGNCVCVNAQKTQKHVVVAAKGGRAAHVPSV